MTSTALSADLFTLSKKTSVGRLGELQAAAGAFGAAELTLRRGFNFNAELGAFAKANANVRKFAAASLGVEAKAGARIQAQAQFPLDFFSECGAVCRLTAAAEAGIYGSLSIGMALEDFRRLYAHDQAGLAMRLGEIFLDEEAARARRAKPKRAKR